MKILELFEGETYPLRLTSDWDIVDYINSVSEYPLSNSEEENLLDNVRGCSASLKVVPVSTLHTMGDIDQLEKSHHSHKKIKKYASINSQTTPPIVVDNGVVIDGNHRVAAFKLSGLKTIPAYVIDENVNEAMCDADREMLAAMDHTVVAEHEKAGYNLFLIQQPDFIAHMMDGCKYQLGLSKAGTECTNHEQHSMKFMKQGERVPLGQLGPFLNVINSWVKKYGRIIVASAESSKTAAYGRIVAKRLPELDIKDKSVMGKEYLVLSSKMNEAVTVKKTNRDNVYFIVHLYNGKTKIGESNFYKSMYGDDSAWYLNYFGIDAQFRGKGLAVQGLNAVKQFMIKNDHSAEYVMAEVLSQKIMHVNEKVFGKPIYVSDDIREYSKKVAYEMLPSDAPENEEGEVGSSRKIYVVYKLKR